MFEKISQPCEIKSTERIVCLPEVQIGSKINYQKPYGVSLSTSLG